MTFFNLPLGPFPLGPVLLTVDVGAGGAVGASLRITACVLSMKLTAELIPWGAVDIWGMLSAQILMFLVQIELTGRILQTKVPVTATVGFQKFPLRFGLRMDLEVVPIAFNRPSTMSVSSRKERSIRSRRIARNTRNTRHY